MTLTWKIFANQINQAKTKEDQEAIVIAFTLHGRKIYANQIIDKLFNIQTLEDPTGLQYYKKFTSKD